MRKTSTIKSRNISKTKFGTTNIFLGLACVAGITVFVLVSLFNSSARLSLSQLEREIQDLVVSNNSLSMEIARASIGVSNTQRFSELGLVDVGAIEYAQGQSSAVALR